MVLLDKIEAKIDNHGRMRVAICRLPISSIGESEFLLSGKTFDLGRQSLGFDVAVCEFEKWMI